MRTLALLIFASVALAQPWMAPGDLALRHDIQLLADAGILNGPVTTWPMSWPDIERQVLAVSPAAANDPRVASALAHVRLKLGGVSAVGVSNLHSGVAAAERPTVLRTFSDTPREKGALEVGGSWMSGRFAANVELTAVTTSVDDQKVRLDGSYAGVRTANWMVSAGWMDRWWGPGWEGSLILSNNARPIPSLTVERNYSEAFRNPLLKWIGPWRASISMGRLDSSDVAVVNARLFAARANFRPRAWLEVGVSRTAQWCGEGRPCDLSTFGKLLAGRDNRSASLSASAEPGNQMAGYDFRLRSPWKALRAAFYGQLIGEDEAGGLPSKFLGLMGAEAWGDSGWGSYRVHAEFADTSCEFSRQRPQFNCAYRNGLYPQGYTFRGRIVGDALDNDGRMYSVGAILVRADGSSWSALARKAELNRDEQGTDPTHTVSRSRDELKNLELQYNRAFARGELGVGLGLDAFGGPLQSGSSLRGFVQWRQGF